ncbi:MAG: hypothetical protein ACRD1X_03715 [Vicinamibacteria bacterium]
MKVAVLVALICLIPVVLKAIELNGVAQKERSRRLRLTSSHDGKLIRSFNDTDLEAYHRVEESETLPGGPRQPPLIASRELSREHAFWRKEKVQHDRELARLDAQIRRLEWRLSERKARRQPGERLRWDATEHVLEESIESLRETRALLIQAFHERARKAGALPGWLR